MGEQTPTGEDLDRLPTDEELGWLQWTTVPHLARLNLGMARPYGFKPSFNQTFSVADSPTGWWATPYHFGIDQSPVVLAVENYRTGLIWDVLRRCPYLVAGLRRAGFTGEWL
jgi:hypothetical protein